MNPLRLHFIQRQQQLTEQFDIKKSFQLALDLNYHKKLTLEMLTDPSIDEETRFRMLVTLNNLTDVSAQKNRLSPVHELFITLREHPNLTEKMKGFIRWYFQVHNDKDKIRKNVHDITLAVDENLSILQADNLPDTSKETIEFIRTNLFNIQNILRTIHSKVETI